MTTYAALTRCRYGGLEHRVIEPDCDLAGLVDSVVALIDTQKSYHFMITDGETAAKERTEALRERFNSYSASIRVYCLSTRCEMTPEQYCFSVVLLRLPIVMQRDTAQLMEDFGRLHTCV